MSQDQRKLFAEGFVNLANVVAGALVFGQFIAEKDFSFFTFSIGAALTIGFYLGAYGISKTKVK